MSISKSTGILLMGWSSMLIGLFLPIITLPEGDPHVRSLVMFLGLHDDAYGWKTAIALIIAPLKHSGWVVFSIPLWLGLIAPAFLSFTSKILLILLVFCYGLGFIVPIFVLIFSLKADGLIGIGYYVWALGMFLLMASRVSALFR